MTARSRQARAVRRRDTLRRFRRLGKQRIALGVRSRDSGDSSQHPRRGRSYRFADLGEFVALAVGHELYHHRERIGEISVIARSPRARIGRADFRPRAAGALDVNVLVAGIDGGQSSTVAVIGDETGRILGRGTAGPADEIGVGKDSTRLRDALRGALEDARRNAQLPAVSTSLQSLRGSAVTTAASTAGRRSCPRRAFGSMHDTPIAHAGALGGRAGVVVIAGTGSVVYGRNDDGWSCTLGGWGFLFGDEGSAFRHRARCARDADARARRRRCVARMPRRARPASSSAAHRCAGSRTPSIKER